MRAVLRMTLKLCLIPMTAAVTLPVAAQRGSGQVFHVAAIDYFGYAHLSLTAVAAVMPVQAGEPITFEQADALTAKIDTALTTLLGHPATDVAYVCCTAGDGVTLYVGLGSSGMPAPRLRLAPRGSQHLPAPGLRLHDRASAALANAVLTGRSREDDAKGYALSEDPAARRQQLAMRTYALRYGVRIASALDHSADTAERRAAAELLGYAKRSPAQIASLTRAATDPDGEVRNTAVRALSVLASVAGSGPFPAAPFLGLLASGKWTDRNKAVLLLEHLSRTRDQSVVNELRTARELLREGAAWHDPGHADPFLLILGRIDGIPEERLTTLLARGERNTILSLTHP